MAVADFRGLVVWQRARETAVAVYRLTERFPREERAGLASQMRRAAASIMANIAEGNGRRYRREYCRYLYIAVGSVRELQSHILLARELDYAPEDSCTRAYALTEDVRRMLRTMLRSLQEPPRS